MSTKVFESYSFGKEALIVWTMKEAAHLIQRGIRLNCFLSGPTQTLMTPEFEKIAPKNLLEATTQPINCFVTPEEKACPLIFLNSPAASYVNDVALQVDGGFTGGAITGQLDMSRIAAGMGGETELSTA